MEPEPADFTAPPAWIWDHVRKKSEVMACNLVIPREIIAYIAPRLKRLEHLKTTSKGYDGWVIAVQELAQRHPDPELASVLSRHALGYSRLVITVLLLDEVVDQDDLDGAVRLLLPDLQDGGHS